MKAWERGPQLAALAGIVLVHDGGTLAQVAQLRCGHAAGGRPSMLSFCRPTARQQQRQQTLAADHSLIDHSHSYPLDYCECSTSQSRQSHVHARSISTPAPSSSQRALKHPLARSVVVVVAIVAAAQERLGLVAAQTPQRRPNQTLAWGPVRMRLGGLTLSRSPLEACRFFAICLLQQQPRMRHRSTCPPHRIHSHSLGSRPGSRQCQPATMR